MDGPSMFTPVSFHPRKKMRSVLDWAQGYIIERGIMRVEALTLFLSVAQHRSISKAAREPAPSLKISRANWAFPFSTERLPGSS